MFFAGIVTATVSLLEQYVVCLLSNFRVPKALRHFCNKTFLCCLLDMCELSNLPKSLMRELCFPFFFCHRETNRLISDNLSLVISEGKFYFDH